LGALALALVAATAAGIVAGANAGAAAGRALGAWFFGPIGCAIGAIIVLMARGRNPVAFYSRRLKAAGLVDHSE
jgi:hypothetical protein